VAAIGKVRQTPVRPSCSCSGTNAPKVDLVQAYKWNSFCVSNSPHQRSSGPEHLESESGCLPAVPGEQCIIRCRRASPPRSTGGSHGMEIGKLSQAIGEDGRRPTEGAYHVCPGEYRIIAILPTLHTVQCQWWQEQQGNIP